MYTLEEINAAAETMLSSNDWSFYDPRDFQRVVAFLTSCFINALYVKQTSAHFKNSDTTFIVAGDIASVIVGTKSSSYRGFSPIVQWNDLEDDMERLCMALQIAYLRIDI